MDALKSLITWPFITIFSYVRFLIGILIVFPSIIYKIFRNDLKSISKFDQLFKYLSIYPLGLHVFSGIVPFFAPYTSSVSPIVVSLTKTNCKAIIYDYPWLRNPFQSIHAIALANLGEFSGGLAMVTQLQYVKQLRGIITKITMEYKRKARGLITAIGVCPDLSDFNYNDLPIETLVVTNLYDKENALVAICTVTWIISTVNKHS